MDSSFNPEYLKPVDLICESDSRSNSFARIDTQTGEYRPLNLVDRHNDIALYRLSRETPEKIRVHFETAKNLYLYAWFVYRFYPVAEQQVLASLEFALRERLTEFVEQYRAKHRNGQEPGLGALLRHAIKQQLLRNDAFTCRDRWALEAAKSRYRFEQMKIMMDTNLAEMELDDTEVVAKAEEINHDWLNSFLESLPFIRNDYAHGSSTLYPSILRRFEIVMEIINQLYPESATSTD